MPRVLVHTLGCKLNQLESESYREQFADTEEDIVIINTCTVTSKAEQKARRVISKALKDYPNAKIIVTGCYAKLEPEAIKSISRKDAKAQRLVVKSKEELLHDVFDFFPEKFSKHTRSFLKIQDGCDNHCTYCRIRLARGKSVSLSVDKVLERCKTLEQSYAETVLTGVNITQYSFASLRLCEMLEYVLARTDKIAIRLSSLDPRFIDENFVNVLKHKRLRSHFHLSIQSCSEKILQRMGRSYNAEIIEKAVSLLRKAKDDPFLACDIITGFPGETEEDFKHTYELLKKLDFAWIHVFPYSKRPGTPAAEYKEKVKDSEVTRRVQMLTDLAWYGRREYVKRWLGREVEVIAMSNEQGAMNNEGTVGADIISANGLTENYLKVLIRCEGSVPEPGTVLKCKLIEQALADNDEYDAIADIISAN